MIQESIHQRPGSASPCPDPQPVRCQLQAILETGSRWSETGNDPRTGVSCYGLIWWAYQQAGVMLPRSVAVASLLFAPVPPPYQPWDVVVCQMGSLLEPRHLGLLLTAQSGYHCSHTTQGVAQFTLHHPLWQRTLRQVVRYQGGWRCD